MAAYTLAHTQIKKKKDFFKKRNKKVRKRKLRKEDRLTTTSPHTQEDLEEESQDLRRKPKARQFLDLKQEKICRDFWSSQEVLDKTQKLWD